MKFASTAVLGLLLAEQTASFSPFTPVKTHQGSSATTSSLSMALDMPTPAEGVSVSAPAPATPVVQKNQYGPTDVRYSDFLKLVDADKIEKVTFSADGTQLLGVDVEGTRVKIEALPNDPGLLTQLTDHKVRSCFVRIQILVHGYSEPRLNNPIPMTDESLSVFVFHDRLMLPSCRSKKRAGLVNSLNR